VEAGNQTGFPSGSVPPLLRAILELREVVNRLIDEQESRLLALEAESEPNVAPNPGPSPEPSPVPDPPDLAEEAAVAEPRPRRAGPPAPKPAPATPVQAPAAVHPAPDDPTSGVRPEDARRRLDALARRLDERLKHPGGSGPHEGSGRGGEG
jgi:hypothetical protein